MDFGDEEGRGGVKNEFLVDWKICWTAQQGTSREDAVGETSCQLAEHGLRAESSPEQGEAQHDGVRR